MGDRSSVEVNAEVNNTVKSQKRRTWPPKHAPGAQKTKLFKVTWQKQQHKIIMLGDNSFQKPELKPKNIRVL